MQNATATTSILISMVGTKIIPSVKVAIPVLIGANIGTCVTNSLIALTFANDPNQFQKAFSAATLNDIFNLLTTLVILPIDELTNFLDLTSKAITNLIPFSSPESMANVNFLSFIIDPVCERFIQLDKNAVERLLNGSDDKNIALRCCNDSNSFSYDDVSCLKNCNYWCVPLVISIGDAGTGLFWIILSLVVIIICMFGIVKVLSLIIVGPIESWVNKALNANLPGKLSWFTECLLFIISLLITIIVQSSNIVSATLVPLHAINLVTLKRVYVIVLGSNIGTTVTGILTAFTQPASAIKNSLQLAFVYTIFNTLGALLWLPIPKLRLPLKFSAILGENVLKYSWFVKFYMTIVYFIIPIFVFLLSLIPYWIGIAVVGIPLIIFILLLLVIKILQKTSPKFLPLRLRTNFKWLPKWLNSLKPLDNMFQRMTKCFRCKIVHEFHVNGDNQVVLRGIVKKNENGVIKETPIIQRTRF